jgi:hypothetical protein
MIESEYDEGYYQIGLGNFHRFVSAWLDFYGIVLGDVFCLFNSYILPEIIYFIRVFLVPL